MSRANERLVSDALIDRLVDGEFDEIERRGLLLQLEAEPGGWRRCALAFLEAQAWTSSLREAADSTFGQRPELAARIGPKGPIDAPLGSPIGDRPQRFRRIRPMGLRVAGLVLAFVGGWLVATAWHAPETKGVPLQAESSTPIHPAIAPPHLTSTEAPLSRPQDGSDPAPASRQASGGLETSPWAAAFPPPLPVPLRRHLERQGYHVEQRSGLVSMELKDGQRFGVPVDEVELRYVGDRTY